LKRSNPPISDFVMLGTPITSESLVQCLELLYGVNYLELSGHSFDDYVVSRLCWNPDLNFGIGENIAPCLFSLKILGCSSRCLAVGSFVLMVQSRYIIPEFIGEDNFSEIRMIWRLRYSPDEMLSHIVLRKSIVRNGTAVPNVAQEIARNPLICSYTVLGDLVLMVEE